MSTERGERLSSVRFPDALSAGAYMHQVGGDTAPAAHSVDTIKEVNDHAGCLCVCIRKCALTSVSCATISERHLWQRATWL